MTEPNAGTVASVIMELKKETVHKYRYGEDCDPIHQRCGDLYLAKGIFNHNPPRRIMVTVREVA